MKIPEEKFKTDCRPGEGGKTCRYAVAEPRGFVCEKHGRFAEEIDRRVEAGLRVERGDNCEGLRPPGEKGGKCKVP